MSKKKRLKKMQGVRTTFSGSFDEYGDKLHKGYDEKTFILKNIKTDSNGEVVADYQWFNLTKGFEVLGELKYGDVIRFDARVRLYKKGSKKHKQKTDYKLKYPTRIEKLNRHKK